MVSAEQHEYDQVRFLIVDDDEVSRMSIQRAMRKLNIANPTQTATDGEEALAFLRSEVNENNVLPPYIVTLDLRMPRMNGHEFLEEIRNDPIFSKLVVFVLTTSDAPEDVSLAYNRNVAGYIVKSNATETFREALALLNDYSQLVVIPR